MASFYKSLLNGNYIMADSTIATRDVENWIRNEWSNLPLIPSLVRRGQA